MTTTDNSARQQAQAQLEHIRDLMEWLDHAYNFDGDQQCEDNETGTCDVQLSAASELSADPHDADAAQQAIHEHPLSIEVRSDWLMVGMLDEDGDMIAKPAEYRIQLCTGGPAVRIVGDLDNYGQPESARIEYQDWFTPWKLYADEWTGEGELLRYAQQFYYGS